MGATGQGAGRGSHPTHPPNPSLGKPLLANTEEQENKLWFLPGLGKPLGRAWRLLQLQEQDGCSYSSPGKVLGWGTPSILPPCPPLPPCSQEEDSKLRAPQQGAWPHTTHSHGSQT